MSAEDPGLWRRLCRWVKPEWMFIVLLIVAGLLLYLGVDGFDDGAREPLGKVALLGGGMLVCAFLAAIGQRLGPGPHRGQNNVRINRRGDSQPEWRGRFGH